MQGSLNLRRIAQVIQLMLIVTALTTGFMLSDFWAMYLGLSLGILFWMNYVRGRGATRLETVLASMVLASVALCLHGIFTGDGVKWPDLLSVGSTSILLAVVSSEKFRKVTGSKNDEAIEEDHEVVPLESLKSLSTNNPSVVVGSDGNHYPVNNSKEAEVVRRAIRAFWDNEMPSEVDAVEDALRAHRKQNQEEL